MGVGVDCCKVISALFSYSATLSSKFREKLPVQIQENLGHIMTIASANPGPIPHAVKSSTPLPSWIGHQLHARMKQLRQLSALPWWMVLLAFATRND
jgi:hypothetical protein